MGGLASPTHPTPPPSFSRQNKDNHARGGSIWLLAICNAQTIVARGRC